METIVLHVCGLWFWMTRRFRQDCYREAADTLKAARTHLAQDFAGRASVRERGHLLPDQIEALALLDRHRRFATRTVRRLESLIECCRFVTEELTGAPPRPVPIALPSRTAFTPMALRTALAKLLPDTRSGAVQITPIASTPAVEPVRLPKAA